MLRKILIAAVLVLMVSFIYYLLNSDTAEQADITASNSGFVSLLKGNEFSAVAIYKGSVYAGGIQGLFKINPETFNWEELKENGRPFATVRAIVVDNDLLWVGHEKGITILGGNEIQHIGKEDGLTDTRVIDLARIDGTMMYAATHSGVAMIGGDAISHLTVKEGLPGDTIKTILKDSSGWVWFGAYTAKNGGVVCVKDKKRQAFDINNGLVHNCITSIVETPDGHILAGGGLYTEGGVSVFEFTNDEWRIVRNLKKEDGLAGEKVRNIFIDGEGNTWFCSEYDGVAIFKDSGEIAVITEKDGLSDNEVKKVVQDDRGNYWLATKSGITYVPAYK